MKVLFLTNIPSPYRVAFFNELSHYCELTVLYEKKKSDERNVKWKEKATDNYESIYLSGIKTGVDNAFCIQAVRYIKRNRFNYIVICGISTPTEILVIQWCKLHKIPYCIEGDGAFVNKNFVFKEKLKRYLIKDAHLCFSTGVLHDQYYKEYGARKDRIVRYPFTSLKKSDILERPLHQSEKKVIKNKLGMFEKKIVLSVGQFIYRKGFDVLLNAAKRLEGQIGIYIVGGEPTAEYLDFVKRKELKNVHFVGFKSKAELEEYYKASDLFVLPTREDIWGLVINEAMAYGLPVITTKRCAAGVELVVDGENGYLVDVNSSEQLVNRITEILDIEDVASNMGTKSLEIVRRFTIEKMSTKHMEIFEKYLLEK